MSDLGPEDVHTQADLAMAMESVKAHARISLGGIARKSASSTAKISKTTANNITKVGKSLPTEGSLRAFLQACQVDSETVDEWCATLERIRFDDGSIRPIATQRTAETVAPPEGKLWQEMLSLPLFNRLMKADATTILPAIRDLIEHATSILNVDYETGSSYALHGVRHSISVVRRLGQLVGADVKKLNAHEAGLLIIGSFFHDVGRIPNLPLEILAHHVRRYLDHAGKSTAWSGHDMNSIPAPLLEDYCKWDRTRRLDEYLKQLPSKLLDWDGIPMRESLSVVCAEQARPLRDTSSLDALPGVDIALCSSLLRLATRLELCSVRPAHDIYRRLGIERRSEPRHSSEDLEWLGYVRRLTLTPKRHNADYIIEAAAIMLRPVAEFDLRNLLNTLQEEFLYCQTLRTTWGEQWQRLPLPSAVDITRLKGIGYTYEKLTFELVRDDVLQLLGGTKLYGNPNVFVRELLQNAIDAVRLRNILDPSHGGGAVEISCWESDGSIWFRIDDDGIGMDLHTIREYFLQIGRSYYNSDDLYRELRHLGTTRSRFGAISRFGIGVMSCFMLGNRIEVSTRRFNGHSERCAALRLSIDQQEDFATLRKEGQGDDPIPAGPGMSAIDFREACGTTVAVRIDAAKHYIPPRVLLGYAAYFHFTGECTITLNGKNHAGVDLQNPIIDRLMSTQRSLGRVRKSEFTARHLGEVCIFAVPLDVTGSSPDPRVQGQLVAIIALAPTLKDPTLLDLLSPSTQSKLNPLIRDFLEGIPISVEVDVNVHQISIQCSYNVSKGELLAKLGIRKALPHDYEERQNAILRHLKERYKRDFGNIDARVLAEINDAKIEFKEGYDGFGIPEVVSRRRWWSHNGVTLPVKERREYVSIDPDDEFGDEVEFNYLEIPSSSKHSSASVFLVGNVSFMDNLRPDLSLARDEVEAVPFAMSAALLLGLRKAIPDGLPMDLTDALHEYCRSQQPLHFQQRADFESILTSVDAIDDGWPTESVIPIGGVERTIAEAIKLSENGEVVLDFDDRLWGYSPAILDLIGAALAQRWLNLRWRASQEPEGTGKVVVAPGQMVAPAEILSSFPPLLFMLYENDTELHFGRTPWNARHPLCAWLISRGVELKSRVPAHFSELREIFLHRSSPSLLHYAMEKQEHNLIDLEALLEGYSTDNSVAFDDELNESDAIRVVLALVKLVVARIVLVAPDLSPPFEVMEFLNA